MKIITRLAIATAFAALAACGSSNNANNSAELNATTDINAGMTDMNATDMNATDLNASGTAMNLAMRDATSTLRTSP